MVMPVVKEKALALLMEIWLALALLLPTPQFIATPCLGTSHLIIDFARLPGFGAVWFMCPRMGCSYSKNVKSVNGCAYLCLTISTSLQLCLYLCFRGVKVSIHCQYAPFHMSALVLTIRNFELSADSADHPISQKMSRKTAGADLRAG